MNSQRYKLIYSKAKGMLIAVAEWAKGYNHNSQQEGVKEKTQTTSQKDTILTLHVLTLSLWTAISPNLAYAQSQIKTYEEGDSNYKPTLLRSENNIPIINIRSINDKGVSRNQYSQFDIDNKGVILNNGRFSSNTQLAGDIDGNYWLLNGEARTIVNEIYSDKASQLNGKIEVAGQTANIIIANPNGIQINGGEFINANNTLLSTGKINYQQGEPIGVEIRKGNIQIKGAGLKYQNHQQNAPHFAQLLSKTAEIHGKITGIEQDYIQIITGENDIGITPSLITTKIEPTTKNEQNSKNQHISTDIGLLGQIYASGINIVSTEQGMGVKNAGEIKANQYITLQANGKITNTGKITAHAENSQIYVKSDHKQGNIENTGKIQAKDTSSVISARDIHNTGVILGDKNTHILAEQDINFNKINYVDTQSNINIQSQKSIKSQQPASINTSGNIILKAEKQLHLEQAKIQSTGENREIQIASNELTLNNSQIQQNTGTLQIVGQKLVMDNNHIQSQNNIDITAQQSQLSNNQINSTSDINIASIQSVEATGNQLNSHNLSISSLDDMNLSNNHINTKQQLSLASNKNINAKEQQLNTGNTAIISQTGDIVLKNSQIQANQGNIVLQSNQSHSQDNILKAKHNISIHTNEANTLQNSQLKADKHIAISSKKADININNQENKQISANGIISIQAEKDINLNHTNIQGGAIVIHSKQGKADWQNAKLTTQKHDILANDKQLKKVNGSLTIKTQQDIAIQADKTIQTAGNLEIQTNGNLILEGESGKKGRGSEKKVNLIADGSIYLKGNQTTIQGSNITAQNGSITAYATGGNLDITAIRSPIAEIKDEERIDELKGQVQIITNQIKQLNQDTSYQTHLKTLSDTQKQLSELNHQHKQTPISDYETQQKSLQKIIGEQKQALLKREKELGVIGNLDELAQQKAKLEKSLKIASTPFQGEENSGATLTATDTIQLVGKESVLLKNAGLTTTDKVIIQALGTGEKRQIIDEEIRAKLIRPLLDPKASMPNQANVYQLIDSMQFDEETFPEKQTVADWKQTLKAAWDNIKSNDPKSKKDFNDLLSQYPPIKEIPIAISIEGLHDVYQRGEEADDAYSLHNNYQPSHIHADKGIIIQAIGTGEITPNQSTTTSPNNILIIGGDYHSKEGDFTVQNLGSTILQAGQDSIFDKETSTVKRGKIKRKTIITTTTDRIQDAEAVKINAQGINIQAGDNLYAYATDFNANDKEIKLQAGDAVRLFAVKELQSTDVDVKKISRFLGIRYNKTHSHDNKQKLTQMPTTLVADITQTASGSDTYLQGTQFTTLEKAHIQAGVGAKAVPDAKIILDSISSTISEQQTKQFNNLVWQSMSDKGSIIETAELPSFTGVEPTFSATGGILVQVPINKDDPNHKEHLVNVLGKMSQEHGFSYLNSIISRDDVDFTAVKLAQEAWDYKQEGLTPAMAVLISVALTAATNGIAGKWLAQTAFSNTLTTAMANTAFNSLVSQAGVQFINNKGNLNKTLKDLGKSENIKNIAKSAIVAGVTAGMDDLFSKVDKINNPTVKATLNNQFVQNFTKATGGALAESLLYNTDLEETLKRHLKTQLVDTATAGVYQHGVKDLDTNLFIDNVAHKLAAGLTGCLSAKAKDKSCEAAAVGAFIGEMVGDWFVDDEIQAKINSGEINPDSKDYQDILNKAKLSAGLVALLYEFDVDTAVGSAESAVRDNTLSNDCHQEDICELIEKRKKLAQEAKNVADGMATVAEVVESTAPIAVAGTMVQHVVSDEKDNDNIPQVTLPTIIIEATNSKFKFVAKIKDFFYKLFGKNEPQFELAGVPNATFSKTNKADDLPNSTSSMVSENNKKTSNVSNSKDHANSENARRIEHNSKLTTTVDGNLSVTHGLSYDAKKELDGIRAFLIEDQQKVKEFNKNRKAGEKERNSLISAGSDLNKDVSIATAIMTNTDGTTTHLLAFSGKSWSGHAPNKFTYNGKEYQVIRDEAYIDGKKEKFLEDKVNPNNNQYNSNHAEKKLMSYIMQQNQNGDVTDVKINIQNTSPDNPGACYACGGKNGTGGTIQDFKNLNQNIKIYVEHGSIDKKP